MTFGILKTKADFKDQTEYERYLIREAQNKNMAATKQLQKEFEGLKRTIMSKYFSANFPQEAIQLEIQDLFDTYIQTYDLSRTEKPSTWLVNNVSEKIKRFLYTHQNAVRANENVHVHIPKYQAANKELFNSLNREPTIEEITHEMNKNNPHLKNKFTPSFVQTIKDNIHETVIASSTIGSGTEGHDLTEGDLAFVTKTDPIENYQEKLLARKALEKINKLPDFHKKVVLHTFNIGGYEQLSQRQLALHLGTNKYQIEKTLKEAISLMSDKGDKK